MDLPKINQKLEFKVLHGPFAAAYSTYVEDTDDHGLVVVHPTVGGEPIALMPGDPVRIEFAVKGSARVAFLSRVVELDVRIVPVVVLALPEPAQVERFQQRDFVRLDAGLKLTYSILFQPDQIARRAGEFQSVTRDISGNGAQILCTEQYPPGTQFNLHLDLAGHPIHLVGEVIRTVDVVRAGEYWLGIRFVGLDERYRDQIIRYIFSEQRERRRTGLL